MKPITVLLVHEQAILRAALTALLVEHADIAVVAAPAPGDDTISACRGHQPDVILLATALPIGVDAIKLRIEQIRDASPDSAILILTASPSATVARAALSAGAVGYLLESELPAELPVAIRRVAAGHLWVSAAVTMGIATLNRDVREDQLTSRQEVIIRSIAWGHTSKEIAVEMSLSRRTIEASRADILTKLDLTSRAGIVKFAVDSGLFDQADGMRVPPPALA
jgi:DNA-binding NarL/FixJ family response regulator